MTDYLDTVKNYSSLELSERIRWYAAYAAAAARSGNKTDEAEYLRRLGLLKAERSSRAPQPTITVRGEWQGPLLEESERIARALRIVNANLAKTAASGHGMKIIGVCK